MRRRRWLGLIVPWLVLLAFAPAASVLKAAEQATFTVNSSADVNDALPGDGECETAPGNHICTLRAAVQETRANENADIIMVPAGKYNLVLSGSDSNAVAGDLDISGTTTLLGAGAGQTIIDASALEDRVIHVTAGSVTISGVTIQSGVAPDAFTTRGGGIFNNGSLILANSVVTGNTANEGGGITNAGHLLLIDSQVTSNTAGLDGGGIHNFGVLTVTNSTISANAASSGSGIMQDSDQDASSRLINSTISGNVAKHSGGGISNLDGVMRLYNVTVAANYANFGQNTSYSGAGVENEASFSFVNSIIARNFRYLLPSFFFQSNECIGTIDSQGANLVGITSASCTISGPAPIVGDPLLGQLANYGGPTRTQALLPGSLAIDAGEPGVCNDALGAPLTTDQRGSPRPADGGLGFLCDLGAFEAQRTVLLPLLRR